MAVLGIAALLLVFYGAVMCAVSGRKLYLSLIVWSLPVFFFVFGVENEGIDGFVILIWLIFSVETIYAFKDIRLWNIENRKNGKIFLYASYVVNSAVSFFFALQSYSAGYMPFLSVFGGFGLYISLLWGLIGAVCSSKIFIYAVDKYFSKKEEFIIIKCSPYRKNGRQTGIKGVQNGRNYVFYTTNRASMLLKGEKSFVLNVRKGILGGMYVSGKELFTNTSRQKKRVNRILIRKAIFSVLLVLVIILFLYRIPMGMSFEKIFAVFKAVILK